MPFLNLQIDPVESTGLQVAGDSRPVSFRVADEGDAVAWETLWVPHLLGTPSKEHAARWPLAAHIRRALAEDRFLSLALANGHGEPVALISLAHGQEHTRINPTGQPMVYVEYVIAEHPGGPCPGAGTTLLRAAIAVSLNMGFCGRVGLHAADEEAESYYRHNSPRLGLVEIRVEETEDGDLLYFERPADTGEAP